MKDKTQYDSPHKCIYCHEWSRSPIIRRGTDQDQSSHKMIFRKCPIIKKQININSEGCKYFKPSLNFYCDKNHCFMNFMVCLNRRCNQRDLDNFEQCKKCRQFENDIKPIVEDYWLNRKEVVKHRVSIKRREKTETKKIIKRREKKKGREIKRRVKGVKSKTKITIKLKRR